MEKKRFIVVVSTVNYKDTLRTSIVYFEEWIEARAFALSYLAAYSNMDKTNSCEVNDDGIHFQLSSSCANESNPVRQLEVICEKIQGE
jgi:hypothetical protein